MTSDPVRFALKADDGFVLAGLQWLPALRPRAILQVLHGLAEHALRYGPFAEVCNARGVGVYAHDHRGHGASVASDTPLGHFADEDGWGKVIGDVHSMNRYARIHHPDLPVFLFGHSMGSFILRAYLLLHGSEQDGAVLSASGWRLGPLAGFLEWMARRDIRKLGPRAPSPTMTRLVFGSFNMQFTPARTRFDWLSRDPAAVDAYVADPLCGFDASGSLWNDFLGGIRAIEQGEDDEARVPKCPLLLIAGGRDPVSMGGFGNAQVAKRWRAAGNRAVTERRYPGARHELVNEINRRDVWADILTWMEERMATNAGTARAGDRAAIPAPAHEL